MRTRRKGLKSKTRTGSRIRSKLPILLICLAFTWWNYKAPVNCMRHEGNGQVSNVKPKQGPNNSECGCLSTSICILPWTIVRRAIKGHITHEYKSPCEFCQGFRSGRDLHIKCRISRSSARCIRYWTSS